MNRQSGDLSAAADLLPRSDENLLNCILESCVVLKFEVPYAICTFVELRPLGAL